MSFHKKYILRSTFIFVLCLSFISCAQENETAPISNDTVDPEIEAIQKTIDELYGSIRVDEGVSPEIEEILYHFSDDARMGSVKDDQTSLKSADEYFTGWKQIMDERQPDLLHEWEIEGKSQHFGNIAYHTSKYGVHFNTTDSLAEQGIINYQLVKLNGDWKVLSMIWQAERGGNKIPPTYFD